MSFFYQTSAAAARSRRTKEREGHPRASSTSTSRRHGINSKGQDSRSPPSKSPTLQASIYTQQNVGLDKLPSLPSSEVTTPTHISPSSSIHQASSGRSGVFQLTQQPYTPISLQQYLDQDQDQDDQNVEEKSEKPDVYVGLEASVDNIMNADISRHTGYLSHIAQRPPPNQSNLRDPFEAVSITSGTKNRNAGSLADGSLPVTHSLQQHYHQDVPLQYSAISHEYNNDGFYETTATIGKTKSEPQSKDLSPSLAETRRRPSSQIVGDVDLKDLPHEASEPQSKMIRTPSQHSAPLLSRTFTPPAPPLGVNRGQVPTSPVFVSPVPVRSRLPGDYHSSYDTAPIPYHYPPTMQVPDFGYHGVYQTYPEQQTNTSAAPTDYGPTTQSALFGLQRTHSNEEQSQDPVTVLAQLQFVLPQLQVLMNTYHQLGLKEISDANEFTDLETTTARGSDLRRLQHLETQASNQRTKHVEEITVLNNQVKELQMNLKVLESELSSQRISRDNMHEKLVTIRVESNSTMKTLRDEKTGLESQLESLRVSTKEITENKISDIRVEMERNMVLIGTLQTQMSQLQESYTTKQAEFKRLSEGEHHNMLKEHEQTVTKLKKQLQDKVDAISVLENQAAQFQKTLKDEQMRLKEQFEIQRIESQDIHDKQITALKLDCKSGKKQNEQLMEENVRLRKELDIIRVQTDKDRTRSNRTAELIRAAATRMKQENLNLLKIIEEPEDDIVPQSHNDASLQS